MDWIAHHGDEVLLRVTLSVELLEGIAARTRDPSVTQLDPYRDTVLDVSLQTRWLRVLREVAAQARAERRRHHEERSRLPRAPDARAAVLDQLLAQDLARDPHLRAVSEWCALLELALESGASVRVSGD